MACCETTAPLAGWTVAVTAHRRADEQAELLRRRGADVVHAPVLRTLPLDDDGPLLAATRDLVTRPPDLVLALTGIGVRGWFGAAEAAGTDGELRAALGGARVVARGPKAAAAVHAVGLACDRVDDGERLDRLLPSLLDEGVAGLRVAVQRYGEPVPWAVDALRAAGAEVVEVPVYRWERVDDGTAARRLVADVVAGRVDAVTFTSAAAVRCLVEVAGELGEAERVVDALGRSVVAAAVGPVTAEALAAAGVCEPCAPATGRLGLLVRSLSEVAGARHRHLAGAGGEVVVRAGLLVGTGGGEVRLTGLDRALFDVLAERPGAVLARPVLRRRVWGGGVDDAAVDSAVARLRRTLAPAGLPVETVPRRGWALRATPVGCPAT